MTRLLGLLLLLGLGWLVIKRVLGASPVRRDPPQPRFEKTVRCARCGVHLPLALARADDTGRSVCTDPDCDGRASTPPETNRDKGR